MIETIIAFLVTNKAIIGVVVSVGEGVVILINLWHKFHSKGEAESMSASPSKLKTFLCVCNPLSLFCKSH